MWPIATWPCRPRELLLVEDLRDEPEVAQRRQPALLGDGDARRLLAAVLEREEPEVREPRDVAVGCVDAEDAAHGYAHLADLDEAARAEPRDARPGAQARIAAPRARLVAGSSTSASRAAPARRLGERVLEPAVADVVAERQSSGAAFQRKRISAASAARLASGRGREQHDVAALPAAGHEPHVRHEPDAADDRRRRDRARRRSSL